MRTKDDPIDYKRDFFGLESYLCDSFGQLQGEAMSKIDSFGPTFGPIDRWLDQETGS